MTDLFDRDDSTRIPYPPADAERMELMLDFFLGTPPYVKCSVKDITHDWERLGKDQLKHLEGLLAGSNLFIVFEKTGAAMFMLKDAARDQIIKGGSYSSFHAPDDLADSNKKKEEDLRGRKKREDRAIILFGALIIIIGTALAILFFNKIIRH